MIHPEYTISANPDGLVDLALPDCEVSCTPTRIEYKEEQTIFVSDEDGIERYGQIIEEIPPKKKIDVIESKWGKVIAVKDTLLEPQQLDLHSKFPPRFFGVRADFSAIEFLRPDTLHLTEDDVTFDKKDVYHPSQEMVNSINVFRLDGTATSYQEYQPLNKPNRAALLKSIHIPKKKESYHWKTEAVPCTLR